MKSHRGATALALGLLLWRPAGAAELSLAVEAEALHAAMPFVLTLTAKGFDEAPTPPPPPLAIARCETTYLGVSPNVSSRIQIINGRRSEWRDVAFVFRWRVLCPAAGRYQVPTLRVEQDGDAASSRPASFEVTDVPASTDMVVRMRLPERALWAGETFDAAVEWLLARDVSDYQFSVPLFRLPDTQVRPPANAGQAARRVRFAAGTSDIELPLNRDEVREQGRSYTRFTFPVRVTLNRSGTWNVDPIQVVARLQTGTMRDSFGFPRARHELFRALGKPRQLVVRPLPQGNRPPFFAGAIGSGFAIELDASRTVVAVGDPIELTIRVRGDGVLTGLSLPPLAGPDALPAAHFTVPDGSPAGVVAEDGRGKRFTVTARVKSAEVREIPSLAFAYFDPVAGEYRIARSQPIALSVDAAQLVGVDDVVAAPKPAATAPMGGPPQSASAVATLLGADMSQSAPEATFARPWGGSALGAWLGALYGAPALVALASFYLVRTGGRRAQSQTMRRALAEVERALASNAPAREAAPTVIAAMRRCGSVAGAEPRTWSASLERLETQAFDPAAADRRMPAELVDELRTLARGWSKAPRRSRAGAALALASATFMVAAVAQAGPASDVIADARAQYQGALAETDSLRRVRLFAKAELVLRQAAAAHPQAPALQVDWGNAALGARDVGRAALAYRRALRVAPGNERAAANLSWLRARLPVWLPRPADAGTLDSLLFWRGRFTSAQLHLIGAGAFALAALLLAGWLHWQRAGLRAGALAATVVWLGSTASALAAGAQTGAVVLEDGAVLRSADSMGAAPAFANPLPAGTEVQVLEERPGWLRVVLADATRGWLPANALERVAPPAGRPATSTPSSQSASARAVRPLAPGPVASSRRAAVDPSGSTRPAPTPR